MTTTKLEALCHKWIEEERAFRERCNGRYNTRFNALADQLAACRRELQVEATLVVSEDGK